MCSQEYHIDISREEEEEWEIKCRIIREIEYFICARRCGAVKLVFRLRQHFKYAICMDGDVVSYSRVAVESRFSSILFTFGVKRKKINRSNSFIVIFRQLLRGTQSIQSSDSVRIQNIQWNITICYNVVVVMFLPRFQLKNEWDTLITRWMIILVKKYYAESLFESFRLDKETTWRFIACTAHPLTM